MNSFDEVIKAGQTSTENALYIFDHSGYPDPDFMTGTWKGSGFHTGHIMDGLLEASGWYGKSFAGPERVHPLIFYKAGGKGVFSLNPALLPVSLLKYPLPKNKFIRLLILAARPLLKTRKYQARLRTIRYRGKLSAAMIYDNQPIIDIFRKVDENTLLGLMDLKGMRQPFFFILTRENKRNT